MNACREYCNAVLHIMAATPQGKFWKALLANASEFSVVDWERSRELSERWNCQPRQCTSNATVIASMMQELQYVEGYACYIIPVEHAWLFDPKTKTVIDPTWCLIDDDEYAPPTDYFGVTIPSNYAIRHYHGRQYWTPAWSKYLLRQEKGK